MTYIKLFCEVLMCELIFVRKSPLITSSDEPLHKNLSL